MKRAFVIVLLFYLAFHFIIPKLYYLAYEDVYIYSDLVDTSAANKAFALNLISVLSTVLILIFLPIKEFYIKPNIKSSAASELLYFAIAYNLLFIVVSGGFQGIVSGGMSGSVFNYLNFFLNTTNLLMAAFFLQSKRTSPIIIILLFIVATSLAGSRSAILSVLIIVLIGGAFSNFHMYTKKVKRFLLIGFIFAPLLFFYVTVLRYGGFDGDIRIILNLIFGRMSFIELGMIPIHYYDNGGLDLDLFYEKYSLVNQLKLIIDSLVPGEVFGYDVMPNNYFRNIFFGYSEEFVLENYMSINITLPVYFYMMFGYWGILATILFILFYFYLLLLSKNSPFISLILLSLLYQILIYFDWVMVFNQFFVVVLTFLTLKLYSMTRNSLTLMIKKSTN